MPNLYYITFRKRIAETLENIIVIISKGMKDFLSNNLLEQLIEISPRWSDNTIKISRIVIVNL